ncbi:hypothetical protein CDAR_18731 [Caerostris darwini]|uniref:Uncharacterized protein n=1 Tax=Caerostris darwini TaxID=1538125 RepID=A0AAV4WBR2_9ARAC|nr:hypothetical protein CDAR_18731 [Caerostris darwini]
MESAAGITMHDFELCVETRKLIGISSWHVILLNIGYPSIQKVVVPVHNPSWCLGHLTPLTPPTNRIASVPGAFQCPQTSDGDFETGKSLQSTPFRIANPTPE